MKKPELEQQFAEDERVNEKAAGAHPVATGGGTAAGAVAGAAIGAVGGPVGAFMGAAIGAIAGGNASLKAAESGDAKDEDDADAQESTKRPQDIPFATSTKPPSRVRDDFNEGGFSGAGQRQSDE